MIKEIKKIRKDLDYLKKSTYLMSKFHVEKETFDKIMSTANIMGKALGTMNKNKRASFQKRNNNLQMIISVLFFFLGGMMSWIFTKGNVILFLISGNILLFVLIFITYKIKKDYFKEINKVENIYSNLSFKGGESLSKFWKELDDIKSTKIPWDISESSSKKSPPHGSKKSKIPRRFNQ